MIVEIRDAFVEIDVPFHLAPYQLLLGIDRVGRAILSAKLTGRAELIDTYINRLVGD